jgi:hypothetical protein
MPIEPDNDLKIHTDDPRVDNLVTELVHLNPIWKSANADYVRSCVILKELDALALSTWQKMQVSTFVRLQWLEAAQKAETLGLFNRASVHGSTSQILAGICLVKSVSNQDKMNVLEIA